MCIRDRGIHSKEVLAVGDSENDLDFLKMVGVKVAAVSYTHLDVYKRQPVTPMVKIDRWSVIMSDKSFLSDLNFWKTLVFHRLGLKTIASAIWIFLKSWNPRSISKFLFSFNLIFGSISEEMCIRDSSMLQQKNRCVKEVHLHLALKNHLKRLKPVSYTHLDVYKRQENRRSYNAQGKW